MPAVLFGSISTIADTSELQREAFNKAFEAHGLDWQWDRDDYASQLQGSGGANRIAEYAQSSGVTVNADAIHETKSELFQKSLAESSLSPRPDVVETVKAAKDEGFKVALVTTTAGDNVTALMDALSPGISIGDFDCVVDASDVEQPKPDKAAYSFALERLAEAAEDCIAIEDNLGGVDAAKAAGLRCVAFPNENTSGHDFANADQRIDEISFSVLRAVPSQV